MADPILNLLNCVSANLTVRRQRLKEKMVALVDQRFDQLESEVNAFRDRVRKRAPVPPPALFEAQLASEWPESVAVTIEEYMTTREDRVDDVQPPGNLEHATTSRTGTKRKRSQSAAVTQRSKTTPTGGSGAKKFVCKSEGCGQSFEFEKHLQVHERIHLNIAPFKCTWPDCSYTSNQKNNVVVHIRTRHFKLPLTKKKQKQLNITDTRDPNEFIAMDEELANRRLQ